MQGLEAVGLQRMIFCLGCSPDAPLSTRNEGGDSVYPVPSTDAHDAPYLRLEASLRGYLAEEAIQFQHACQSLRCARITQFKEVPTHLHLVIQRASEVSQPEPAQATCLVLHHTQLACTGCLQSRLPIHS